MKKKEAMAILEARVNYRNLPSGYIDETDLLILSSIEVENPKKNKKKKE